MTLDIHLLDWQEEFLNSPTTVKALSGASDTGKSWICRLHLILSALQFPRSYHFATATTWTQTYRAIAEPIARFLNDLDVEYELSIKKKKNWVTVDTSNLRKFTDLAQVHKGEGLINFINGSRLELYSSQDLADRIRSREFGNGFFEEASLIPDKHIEQTFFESIRRLRAEGSCHHLLLATNPDLVSRWIYPVLFDPVQRVAIWEEMKKRFLKTGMSEEEAARLCSYYVKQLCFKDGFNRNNKEREAKILMGSKRQIDMFYYGKWGNLEGVAFPLEDGIHVKPIDTNELDKFYISFDYGFHPNPMVYLLASERNGVIFIVDEVILDSIPVNRHGGYLEKWVKGYNVVGYTGETATGAGEIRDLLSGYGIPYYATTKKRQLGWTTISDLIDKQRYVIDPKCKHTIKSQKSMVWVGSTQGVDCEATAFVDNTNPNAKPTPFDDPMDAIRYFVMCPIIYNRITYKEELRKASVG